jgi:hypothetical protein
MKEKTSKNWRSKLFGAFSIIGFLLCAGFLYFWGYQILMWMGNGFWTKHSVAETLPGLFSWIMSWEDLFGVQKILLWVFDLELVIFYFFLGLIIALSFLHTPIDPFQSEGSEDSW